MDWSTHVDAYHTDWVRKYIRPGDAEWKQIWDIFLLNQHTNKDKIQLLGREYLILPMSNYEKNNILKRIPKAMEYFRTCLQKFWKLKLTPNYEGAQKI